MQSRKSMVFFFVMPTSFLYETKVEFMPRLTENDGLAYIIFLITHMSLLTTHRSHAKRSIMGLSMHKMWFGLQAFIFNRLCPKWLYSKFACSSGKLSKSVVYIDIIEDLGSNTHPGWPRMQVYYGMLIINVTHEYCTIFQNIGCT